MIVVSMRTNSFVMSGPPLMDRRKKMRITFWLFIFTIAISVACFAQQTASVDRRITEVLVRMASTDMATRHAGLDDLIKMISEGQKLGFDPEYPTVLATLLVRHPDQTERVKLGLINMLKSDDDAFMDSKAAPGTYTENDTEHWAAAVDLVSSSDDERAIPALVGAMTTGGMATHGILKYGQKALKPVLDKLDDPDPLVRSGAVSTAITILKTKNDAVSQAQIVSLIRMAIHDREFLVRSVALYAIDNFGADREQFLPALKEMAEHDPFQVPGQTNYPLRTSAGKLLQETANH
jgi:hypothetical protein